MSLPVKYSDSDESAFRRIARGLTEWRKDTTTASALILECNERKIWKLKYDSFKEFCELECGFTRQWGYELLETGKAIESVKSLVAESGNSLGFLDELNPINMAPVKGMPPEKAGAILISAKKKSGNKKLTRKAVQQEADTYEPTEPAALSGPKEKEVVRDELGWPIPTDLLPLWDRREILEKLMADLSRIKCEIEKGWKEQDAIYLRISNTAVSEIQGVRWSVKHARPWVVCTLCEGRPKLNVACSLCGSSGFILERDCETLPTVKDVLKIRAKVLEKKQSA